MSKKETAKFTTENRLKYKLCNVTTMFTEPFYMITVDDTPVGKPLSKEDVLLVMDWFDSIFMEFNETESKWDLY